MRPTVTLLSPVAGTALVLLVATPATAGLIFTIEASGVQSSQVPGVVTETFDSFGTGNHTTLNTAVGQMTSLGAAICDSNLWGGAGGSGRYLAVGAQSGSTTALFTFTSPQAYVGLWLSALDELNGIELLSGGNVVGVLNQSSLTSAVNSNYYGNPNSFQNESEAYAYLNFIGTNGTTFDAIRFANTSTGTGLEFDNLSIRATAPDPIPGTPVPHGLVIVPEPAAIGLLAPAAALLSRRRSR